MEKVLIETTKLKADQIVAFLEILRLGFSGDEYYNGMINEIIEDVERAEFK